MADYLLDSDVLIDILKGSQAVISVVRSLPPESAKCFSTISEAELWAGVLAGAPDDAKMLTELLSALRPIQVTRAIAQVAGEYRSRYGRSHGTSLPDALIAASAKVEGLHLMTRHVRHFPMEDIRLVNPTV